MSSKTTFSCGNSLDITHVTGLYNRLERSLHKSNVIELKAEAVEKVDTAGLQLLMSVKKKSRPPVDPLGGKNLLKS